jgi:hypothetical protein
MWLCGSPEPTRAASKEFSHQNHFKNDRKIVARRTTAP